MSPCFTSGDEAFWQGFRDGYRGKLDSVIENEHRSYERGFVMGLMAKREKETKGEEDVVS